MDQLISQLYLLGHIIDTNSIKKTSPHNVQFKMLKNNGSYDGISINNWPDHEGEIFYTIILTKFSNRIGCMIEGYRKPLGGDFGNGWVLMRDTIPQVISVLSKLI
jgi:hypothetical protein